MSHPCIMLFDFQLKYLGQDGLVRPAFHVCISTSSKVALVHLSVTISMNLFLLAGTLPMCGNAT